MTGIQKLEAATNAAEDWVDALMQRLGWHDRQKVYLALFDYVPRGGHSVLDDVGVSFNSGMPGYGEIDRWRNRGNPCLHPLDLARANSRVPGRAHGDGK